MKRTLDRMGSVMLGDKFVFRTATFFGPDYAGRRSSVDEKTVTVIGFKPRYVNQVVLCDSNGHQLLMPLHLVEKALALKAPN